AEAGNWSKLKQAREHAFYADTTLALARAEQARMQARESLLRLLGVSDPARVQLPARLPELPVTLAPLPAVEQQAMASRLDLQMVKLQADALAKNLGLTRNTRVINVLELGFEYNTSNEEPTQRGYEISFELPLFDWGESRVVAAAGAKAAWSRPSRATARRSNGRGKPRSTPAPKCARPMPCCRASTPWRGMCATRCCR
ncbi:MAG: TolC family protein, partial [Thiobacillaceae bacterium]|nr:TolC family protein [Thiobacillaceae bacterium]